MSNTPVPKRAIARRRLLTIAAALAAAIGVWLFALGGFDRDLRPKEGDNHSTAARPAALLAGQDRSETVAAPESQPNAVRTIQVLDRATLTPVAGLVLSAGPEKFTTSLTGLVKVPSAFADVVKIDSPAFKAAPSALSDEGVLYVVARLKVRVYCTVGGRPFIPAEGEVVQITLVRATNVPITGSADEDGPSWAASTRWLTASGLARERYSRVSDDMGRVSFLTWNVSNQAIRVSVGSPTPRKVSQVVPLPMAPSAVVGNNPYEVHVSVALDEPLYTVRGSVTSADGTPLKNVKVTVALLRRLDGTSTVPTALQPAGHSLTIRKKGSSEHAVVANKVVAKTNERGEYTIETPVDAHETLVLIHHDGFKRGKRHLTRLSSRSAGPVDIILEPLVATDHAKLTADGAPVPAGSATFIDVESEPQFHFRVSVDRSGHFAAHWLEPDRRYHLFYKPSVGKGLMTGNFTWTQGRATLAHEELDKAVLVPFRGR